jgi:hypothetical protein
MAQERVGISEKITKIITSPKKRIETSSQGVLLQILYTKAGGENNDGIMWGEEVEEYLKSNEKLRQLIYELDIKFLRRS